LNDALETKIRSFHHEIWDHLVKKFILSFRSQQTRETYLRSIQNYISHPLLNRQPNLFSEECLILWMKSLDGLVQENKLDRQSVNTYTSALSSFFKFLVEQKIIASDCQWLFKRHRYEQRSCVTPSLTLEEVERVFEELENQRKNSPRGSIKREKAVLFDCLWLTLCSVGLRISEICQLRMKDFFFQNSHPRLRLEQKGSRENIVLIHEELGQKILQYQKIYRNPAPLNPLFVIPNQEKPLNRFYIHQNLKKIFHKLKFDPKLSAHSCRSFVASILQEQGTPIAEVQKLLGHKNVNTTLGYVRTLNEYDQAAARKVPLFQKKTKQ
jgi:site-specific recombinase XerD